MKKIVTVLCAFGLICSVQAGVNETKGNSDNTLRSDSTDLRSNSFDDETRSYVLFDGSSHDFAISWKKSKSRKYHTHWSGFGIGLLSYDESKVPNSSLIPSRSLSYSLNITSYGFHIRNTNLMLVTGLGFDWHRYHFDDNARLDRVDGVAQFLPAPEGIKYKSSKLLAYYATVPLMLEFQPTRKFHLAAGAVAFINYYTKSQVKYYVNGDKHIEDMKRDLNLRRFDVKLKAQMGIGGFNIYGYYSPASMFEKHRGPDLKPFNIGLMLGF